MNEKDLGISGIVLSDSATSFLSTSSYYFQSLMRASSFEVVAPSFGSAIKNVFKQRIIYEELLIFFVFLVLLASK
jgi:hypothetical protein